MFLFVWTDLLLHWAPKTQHLSWGVGTHMHIIEHEQWNTLKYDELSSVIFSGGGDVYGKLTWIYIANVNAVVNDKTTTVQSVIMYSLTHISYHEG